MWPADACDTVGMMVAERGPGTWLVNLPNGHRLVARLRRRELERMPPGQLVAGRPVRLRVVPADMTHGWIQWETQDHLETGRHESTRVH